ncbi:3-oxoacyl-(acyl-carrier-protein) synthase [Thermoplasmatales archaeon SCGC AB-539-C06]|nr:3-oxoacyl-(acyl-carrier-protein) synthase [Thermoplasmatales archaeon SCGC AB-539-C06]
MDRRRVVITGMGVVSPIGIGIPAFYDSLYHGKSGVSKITKFDTSDFECQIAAEIKDFNPKDYGIPREITRTCDVFSKYALVAAQEAINNSGLKLEKRKKEELNGISSEERSKQIQENFEEGKRRAVVVGSGMGGMETILNEHKKFLNKGPKRVSGFAVPQAMVNSAAVAISLLYKGINGYISSNSNACATSLFSIFEGSELIKSGRADTAITGGSEAIDNYLALASFQNMGALSTKYNSEPERASRPYDIDRDGFVPSEGAGILVLEEAEHARKRGANILAEIIGFGITTDGYHISAPNKDAYCASQAIFMALKEAGLSPGLIDLISPHATSTPYNDKFETLAFEKVLEEYSSKIPIIPTKCLHGHMVGATAAIETIAGILAMQNSVVFPHINYDNPDPECKLNISKERREGISMKYMLKNSSGFGGHNIAMAVKIPK